MVPFLGCLSRTAIRYFFIKKYFWFHLTTTTKKQNPVPSELLFLWSAIYKRFPIVFLGDQCHRASFSIIGREDLVRNRSKMFYFWHSSIKYNDWTSDLTITDLFPWIPVISLTSFSDGHAERQPEWMPFSCTVLRSDEIRLHSMRVLQDISLAFTST